MGVFNMRVFISWSGPRSRKVAEYLCGWLRKLPLTVRPWVSKEAIDPGTRWEKELSEALEETSFGILCLTPENQLEPWICFETGALSKTVEKTHVIPYLIDMGPGDLRQPLKQFQAIEATKDGTLHLIKTIHKASGDDVHSLDDIKETFEALWPKIEGIIDEAKRESIATPIVEEAGFPEIRNDLGKIVALLESLSYRMTKLESKVSLRPPWLKHLEQEVPLRLSDVLKAEMEQGRGVNYLANLLQEISDKSQVESKPKGILDIIEEHEKKKSDEKKDSKT
jgi:hypothetical protein